MPREALPPPPQGDLDDRAETVEPLTGEAPLSGSTAALFAHHAYMWLWFSRLAGTTANQMLLVATSRTAPGTSASSACSSLPPALALVLVARQVVDRYHAGAGRVGGRRRRRHLVVAALWLRLFPALAGRDRLVSTRR